MKYLIPSLCVLVSLSMPPLVAQEAQQPSTTISPALQEDLRRDHSTMEIQLLAAPLTLDQLTAEAEEWQGFVQASMTRIASLKVAALSAEGEALAHIQFVGGVNVTVAKVNRDGHSGVRDAKAATLFFTQAYPTRHLVFKRR